MSMANVAIIILLFLACFLLFWQISNLLAVFYGSPYVLARHQTVKKTLELSSLKKGETLYDLGCGNGQVLIEAAKMGAKATGFEISPYYYLWAKLRTFLFGRAVIQVKFQNIKAVDLSQADVVYCYLLPKFLEELAPKFKKELKNGARVVSVGFAIPGLKPVKKEVFGGSRIFVYSLRSRSA